IRYTLDADATLNQKVNALDFNALATNFGSATGKEWFQADFNYDGMTNTLDFNVLSASFNATVAPSAPLAAAPVSAPPTAAPVSAPSSTATPDLFSKHAIRDDGSDDL